MNNAKSNRHLLGGVLEKATVVDSDFFCGTYPK